MINLIVQKVKKKIKYVVLELCPNRDFYCFCPQQMVLNIRHVLWLYCLCEAAAATGKV